MVEQSTSTLVHPLALTVMAAAVGFVISLRRSLVLLPVLALICFIPIEQRVVIFGLDFTLLRILVIVALVRLLARGELQETNWSYLDALVVCWTISITLIYIILHGAGATANRLGAALDVWGMYIIARTTIQSPQQLLPLSKMLALLSFPVLAGFTYEATTQYNPFSIFGGVPEFTAQRDGRLRCQGAFHHPIHAGVFWAGLLPIYASLWRVSTGKWRLIGALSTAACVAIIILSASSTPVMGLVAAILGWLLYYQRHYIRTIIASMFGVLVLLHLVMEKPVWHLIARIDAAGGSTGYHRYRLIDAAVSNFNEWWFLGLVTTEHWGRQLFDVTNHYILQGIRGGLLTLVLFLLIIVQAFRLVFRTIEHHQITQQNSVLAWTLGTCIFVHVVCFIAVSYFQQINSLWWMTIGLIGSLGGSDWTKPNNQTSEISMPTTPQHSPKPNYLE